MLEFSSQLPNQFADVSNYLLAELPEPINLLGQRLQPLSIGHCMILERLQNPLFIGGHATEDHLFEAVFVCCQTFSESWESFFKVGFQKQILNWRKKIGQHNFVNAMSVFEDYKKQGTLVPETGGGDDNAKRRVPGAPFLLQLKIALQNRLNYSEQEALNKPFGSAVWEVVALAEMNGETKILNEIELEIAAVHHELIAKGES